MPIEGLRDKAGIVTGGARGIGRAICQALAAEGASVAVADCLIEQLEETVHLIRQAGGNAIAFHVDVTDREGVQRMLNEVNRELGQVELLVNNAGIIGMAGPAWEVDPDVWWHCLDVNLRGAFICSRAVLPDMVARQRGRIINMSSGIALGPWPYVSAYAVSKAALSRFSEILAIEAGEHNIAVFAADPGLVRTSMAEEASSPEWQKWDNLIPQLLAAKQVEVAPERVAQHVLLLASGAADALSGRHLSVYQNIPDMTKRMSEVQRDELFMLRFKTFESERSLLLAKKLIHRLLWRLTKFVRRA
jgi:NAD(P)-dependent dehydrogenase (short-subunit alcohol dehydrogenase family)